MIWWAGCVGSPAIPVRTDLLHPAVTAQVAVSTSPWSVLERRLVITLSAPIDGELRCTSPADPLEDFRLPFSGSVGELRLWGLLAETHYDCALSEGDAVFWRGSFETEPLPVGFPTLVLSGDPARATSDDGYVLFTHWKLGSEFLEVQRLILVDGDGRIRWYLPIPDATTGGLAGALLPSGLVIAGGGQGAAPALYDLSGDPVYRVPPPLQADPGYHHEAQLTPEGWLLSLQGVDNFGPSGGFLGFRIEAVDAATGELRWSFDSQRWLDAGLLPPPEDYTDPDPYHPNAVSWVDDDPEGPSVWVSLRGIGLLMRIDRITGGPVGFWGPDQGIRLVDTQGKALPEQAWFWGQHAPEFRGEQVLVYDNGGRRPGHLLTSRVAAYRRLDATNAQLLWDWTEPGWYEPNFGSVVTMPDGHVFVATGHCKDCGEPGDLAWMLELDPETEQVVWRFDFSAEDDSIYRAQPIDGCALFANARYCPDR